MHLLSAAPPWALSRAANSPHSIRRLNDLQRRFPAPPLAEFTSWDDARRWLEQVGVKSAGADSVLRPVLVAAKPSLDETWQNILLLLFWRQLAQTSCWLSEIAPVRAERDSQIVWEFLRAVHRLDLNRRPEYIGRKLVNDTQHGMRLHFRQQHGRDALHVPILDEHEEADGPTGGGVRDPGSEDLGFAAAEYRHDRDRAQADLLDLASRGRITPADAFILIGCHLYGRSIEEMADRLGVSYETAKRRRQRAAARLKNIARYLSPDLPDTPLEPLRRSPRKEISHDGTV